MGRIGGPPSWVSLILKILMLKLAADRLAEEYDDPALRSEFVVAQQLYANFYHDFMGHDDLERARPVVHDFVARVLDLMA